MPIDKRVMRQRTIGNDNRGQTAVFSNENGLLIVRKRGLSPILLEIKVAYHKAMTKDTGPVRAQGKIITFGHRAAFTEARLTDLDGKLYASATSSLIVLSA